MGPDRPGIHFGFGLKHGNAPFAVVAQDRPVQCRGTAIAWNAGMDDQTQGVAPNVLGNGALEERGDDHVGPEQVDRLAGRCIVDVELDGNVVAPFAQFHVQALRQAVEGMAEQENAHRHSIKSVSGIH